MPHTEVTFGNSEAQVFSTITAQAYITPEGEREILIVNRRAKPYEVVIDGADGGEVSYVDQSTGFHPAATEPLVGEWG